MLQHNVYFYLQEGLNESDKLEFEKGLKTLLNIPDMISGFIGNPANTPDRTVVDKSYAYGLSTTFTDVKQHDIYQEHPTHLKFVDTCKKYWKEVKVYDVEIIK